MFEEFPKPDRQLWFEKLQAEVVKNNRTVESLQYEPFEGFPYELLYESKPLCSLPHPQETDCFALPEFVRHWTPETETSGPVWTTAERRPANWEGPHPLILVASLATQLPDVAQSKGPAQLIGELPCGEEVPLDGCWSWSTVSWRTRGASVRTELAGLLAGWVLAFESDRPVPSGWTTGVDTALLLEVAKIQAARLLWRRLSDLYQRSSEALRVAVVQSSFHWSSVDREVNLLRSTCAVWVANLAGARSIRLLSFEDHPQAQHWAENQNRLFQHEGKLLGQSDPLAGCYAVGTLADQLASQVWSQVQAQLRTSSDWNSVKDWVEGCVTADRETFLERLGRDQEVLVGTSRYAPTSATQPYVPKRLPVEVEHDVHDLRASRPFEKLRQDWAGRKVELLFRGGDRAKLHARLSFTKSFLALAGVEAEELEQASAGAALLVLVCADSDIETEVQSLLSQRSPHQILLVAGPLTMAADRLANVTLKSPRLELWSQLTEWAKTAQAEVMR